MAGGPVTVMSNTIMLVSSELPRDPRETWVLPHTNQTQYQKWMSQKLNFYKDYFICTLPKHIASIDFSKKNNWNMLLHRTLPPIIVVAEPLELLRTSKEKEKIPEYGKKGV